jgi:DNA-binding response OmpR family regulator
MEDLISERQTILVIDDEKANLKILSELFKSKVNIILAKNGTQGIEKIIKFKPDLILLDIIMPGMSGFEVIMQLKKNEEISAIPVIFITGLTDVVDESQGLALGACDYIQKPFHTDIVRARVNLHLKLAEQRLQLEQLANVDSLTCVPVEEGGNLDNTVLLRADIPQIIQDQLSLIKQVKGIKYDLALGNLKGNVEFYLGLVNDFVNGQEGKEVLEQLYGKGDWETLHRIIHSLKSNAAYIGAFELSTLCDELEYPLLEGAPNKALFDIIVKELDILLEVIASIVNTTQTELEVSFSVESLLSDLDKIRPLLKTSDFSVEKYLSRIQTMRNNSEYLFVINKIIELVNNIEYEEASEYAEKLYAQISHS